MTESLLWTPRSKFTLLEGVQTYICMFLFSAELGNSWKTRYAWINAPYSQPVKGPWRILDVPVPLSFPISTGQCSHCHLGCKPHSVMVSTTTCTQQKILEWWNWQAARASHHFTVLCFPLPSLLFFLGSATPFPASQAYNRLLWGHIQNPRTVIKIILWWRHLMFNRC
jgi:hypothetical protein